MASSQDDDVFAEFSSRIDGALIAALVRDYDLEDPNELEALRKLLTALAEYEAVEEATEFNPSGFSSNDGGEEGTDISPYSFGSAASQPIDAMSGDAVTSESTLSEADAHEASGTMLDDKHSDEMQIAQLREMFAKLKPHDIQDAYRKAKGNYSRTVDTLLNIQQLEAMGVRSKGIDGFFRPDEDAHPRKRKGKNKHRATTELGATPSTAGLPSNRLDSPGSIADQIPGDSSVEHSEDILHIAEKMDLPYHEVASVFQTQGQSKAATIIAFLDRFDKEDSHLIDKESGKKIAAVFKGPRKNIPRRYLQLLASVVGQEPAWMNEIAAVLNQYFAKQAFPVEYNMKPPGDGEVENWTAAMPRTQKRRGAASGASRQSDTSSSSASSLSVDRPYRSYETITEEANEKAAARDQSYATAASSRRTLGRYGPAAASVFTQRAREEDQKYRALAIEQAEARIESARTSLNTIDLHGTSQEQAIEIAVRKTWVWWNQRGAGPRPHGCGGGGEAGSTFTLITGRGLHSKDGKPVLLNAVHKALQEDGWRVSLGVGKVLVSGRRRGST